MVLGGIASEAEANQRLHRSFLSIPEARKPPLRTVGAYLQVLFHIGSFATMTLLINGTLAPLVLQKLGMMATDEESLLQVRFTIATTLARVIRWCQSLSSLFQASGMLVV